MSLHELVPFTKQVDGNDSRDAGFCQSTGSPPACVLELLCKDSDVRAALFGNWFAMADTYDTLRLVQVAARRLVDLVPLPAGAQVLDVATGTGWTALAVAQHVGPTGTVVGIDLAPDLLVCARQKRAAAGLTNVELRPGDADVCRFGMNLSHAEVDFNALPGFLLVNDVKRRRLCTKRGRTEQED